MLLQLHRMTLLTIAATYLCICFSVVVNAAPVDTASSQDQLYPEAAALEQQLIQQSGEDRSAAARKEGGQAKLEDTPADEKEEDPEDDHSVDEDEKPGLEDEEEEDVHQVDERARLFDLPLAELHDGGDSAGDEDKESCYACQQASEDVGDSMDGDSEETDSNHSSQR